VTKPVIPSCSQEHLIYIAGMRRRVVSTLAMALALFLLASCGSSGEPSSNDSGEPSSNDTALAARGRASLVATFTDTPWRLPPATSPKCENERQSSRTTRDTDDFYEDAIYCSLNSSAMTHLLRRLDRALGTDVTATQRTCINRKVTRDQIAALLAAQETGGDDRAAIVEEFDDQLASAIRQCTRN
jgi:hypothetical protein